MRLAALLLLALLAGCNAQAGGTLRKPQAQPRIVSINPCTDAILAQVADPEQILSLSNYSHDPRASSMALSVARRFPANGGTVEEVLAFSPDLVVAGGHVGPATVDALARLGIPLLQLPVANSVADSHAGVRALAKAAGHAARGEAMIAQIDAALAAAAPADRRAIPVIVWQGGGLVPGEGTLIDDLLRRTGMRNVAGDRGLAQWDVLGLEPLIADPPALILQASESGAQDDRMLAHPAVAKLRGTATVVRFEPNLVWCGGQTIARAAARLASVRAGLP